MESGKAKNQRINIIVYSESEEQARYLISRLVKDQATSEADIWNEIYEGVELFGYIRWPKGVPTAQPLGVTDVLVVHSTGTESENWETIKTYVDQRSGIPFKFLTSNNDLNEAAKSLDAEYINFDEFKGDNIKSKIVKSALELENTLRTVFKKLDLNGDGTISSDEIVMASSELKHILNSEDAKEIAKTLAKDGRISFDRFKQWWIMGRSDFGSFRKLVSLELGVNNFFQDKGQIFSTYLERLQKLSQESANSQVGFNGRVNIAPEKDFEAGTALGVHVSLGNEFTDILNSLPSYIRETPASIGLEIHLKNPQDGKEIIETLTQVKEMIIAGLPSLNDYIQNGVTVNFRHVDTSVYVDISYGGLFGDQLNGILSMFNLSAINFTGASDWHITTEISPTDLLTDSLDQLLSKLVNFKIEGKGEYGQLKNIITFAIDTFTSLNQGNVPKKIKPFFYLLKVASVIRKLDFTFNYDPAYVKEVATTCCPEENFFETKSSEWQEGYQPMINSTVEQFSTMGVMMLEPYKPTILAVDFEKISFYACSPVLKGHVKVNLMIKGINEFIKTLLG